MYIHKINIDLCAILLYCRNYIYEATLTQIFQPFKWLERIISDKLSLLPLFCHVFLKNNLSFVTFKKFQFPFGTIFNQSLRNKIEYSLIIAFSP